MLAGSDVQMQHLITSNDLELREHDDDSESPDDYKSGYESPFADRLINATASFRNHRVAG